MSTINQSVEECVRNHNRQWVNTAQPGKDLERELVARTPAVTLQHETINGIPVLRCSGRIVFGPESEYLFAAIRNMLLTSPTLILDFRQVTMVDAKGVGALLKLHALARSKNGSIGLVHVNERVGRVLRLTNLLDLFQLHDSEALAVQAR
jgi:anti-anti-sigma factor